MRSAWRSPRRFAEKAARPWAISLDDIGDFDADPTLTVFQSFVASPADLKASLLKNATSRFVYDLDRYKRLQRTAFRRHVGSARPMLAIS